MRDCNCTFKSSLCFSYLGRKILQCLLVSCTFGAFVCRGDLLACADRKEIQDGKCCRQPHNPVFPLQAQSACTAGNGAIAVSSAATSTNSRLQIEVRVIGTIQFTDLSSGLLHSAVFSGRDRIRSNVRCFCRDGWSSLNQRTCIQLQSVSCYAQEVCERSKRDLLVRTSLDQTNSRRCEFRISP